MSDERLLHVQYWRIALCCWLSLRQKVIDNDLHFACILDDREGFTRAGLPFLQCSLNKSGRENSRLRFQFVAKVAIDEPNASFIYNTQDGKRSTYVMLPLRNAYSMVSS